ncbi:MAG: hypothetical protein CBR30_07070 [Dictyoglomus sp. NZ13-RE01]|nr:MAG: hypothetical protein CBR30_07070 [Dictyoglomus sp. NZ13-RE01]
MRKYIIPIFLILFLLSFAFAETKAYVDEKNGFSIVPPEGWEVLEGSPYRVAVIFRGPINFGFATNINIGVTPVEGLSDEDFYSNIDSFLEAVLEELSASFDSFNIVSQKEILVNNLKAYEIEYTFEYQIFSLKQKQVYIFKNGKLYAITFTSTTANYDQYLPIFEDALQTFNIL